MTRFRLQLLGSARVRCPGGRSVELPLSVQPLLAYLALEHTHSCHRERVLDALWPDLPPDSARRRLNTAVWRLRQLLGREEGAVLRTSKSGHLALDTDRVELDVAELLHALEEPTLAAARRHDAAALAHLDQAVHEDTTTFLAGCYDNWVVRARERLNQAALRALETLIDAAPGDRSEVAIAWLELLLERDPLREDAHRRLMRLYALAGRRMDALRQFERCEQVLRSELGVEPLPETALVAAAVREEMSLRAPAQRSGLSLGDVRSALAECRRALDSLERALDAHASSPRLRTSATWPSDVDAGVDVDHTRGRAGPQITAGAPP